MKTLRFWIVLSWIALPLAMVGGAFLLQRFVSAGGPVPFEAGWLRAGHAHGTVLILLSLVYYLFLDQTPLPAAVKVAASAALFTGVLAQSGGFFLHAAAGLPGQPSIGTAVTLAGAVLLAFAITVLIYGLISPPKEREDDRKPFFWGR